MAIDRIKVAVLADRLEELASRMKTEWAHRERRASNQLEFVKTFTVPTFEEAGGILEKAFQAGAFRDDRDFVAAIKRDPSRTIKDGRHRDIFLGLWQRWLPKMGHPYRANGGYDYADALTAFAGLIRGDATRDQPQQPKGVTWTMAAFELQSMSDDEDTDDERLKRASDMSQKWGKRRTIKWPTPIGIDPQSKADLFDVVELVAVLADATLIHGEVIKYGGEKPLVAKLRKIARESLPIADCIAIRARRATRTTRSSAKSRKTSRAKTPANTRHA